MKKWVIICVSSVLIIILALLITFKVMFVSKNEVKEKVLKDGVQILVTKTETLNMKLTLQ